MSARRKGRGGRARRVRRWLRRLGALAVLAGLAAAGSRVPGLLRGMDVFRVTTVEVTGTRFLEPYAVVRAAGLDRSASLFDDHGAWRAGVMTLPLVADVRVRRQPPATVRLEVREVEPVALVGGARLRPVDATGELISLEPAGVVLDLPVVLGAALERGRVATPAAASAVAVLATLGIRAPELADRISEIEVGAGQLRVGFRGDGFDAVLPAHPTDRELLQLRLTHADLRSRGELDRVRTIDVRFRDQVVVSFLDNPVS